MSGLSPPHHLPPDLSMVLTTVLVVPTVDLLWSREMCCGFVSLAVQHRWLEFVFLVYGGWYQFRFLFWRWMEVLFTRNISGDGSATKVVICVSIWSVMVLIDFLLCWFKVVSMVVLILGFSGWCSWWFLAVMLVVAGVSFWRWMVLVFSED